MAAGDQGDQHALDNVFVADDDLANLVAYGVETFSNGF